MKTILFVTTRVPSSQGSADQITTFEAISYLKSKGYNVELEVFEIDEKKGLKFYITLFLALLRSVFTFMPVQVTLYSMFYKKSQKLSDLKKRFGQYDRVYVHLIRPLGLFNKDEICSIYVGAQISQYLNLLRLSKNTKNLVKKVFYFYEAIACKRFEEFVVSNAKKVNFVAAKDVSVFSQSQNITAIAHGVDLPNLDVNSFKSKVYDLIFVANYKADTNKDALYFLINTLFPLAKKENPDISLCIAGRNIPSNVVSDESKSLTVLGEVEKVHEAIAKAKVFINPLRASAGMQNKVLTSMAAGVKVIATDTSVEGMSIPEKLITTFDFKNTQDFLTKLETCFLNNIEPSELNAYVSNNWTWDALHSRWSKEFLNV